MLQLENLALFSAQDALLTALRAQVEPLGLPADLGFPRALQPEHVWISGDADGTALYEETGTDPSRETFRIMVHALTTYAAEEYADTRGRLATILTKVTDAIESAGFVGSAVDQARIMDYHLEEGRDGEGRRQLALTIEIECDKWTG